MTDFLVVIQWAPSSYLVRTHQIIGCGNMKQFNINYFVKVKLTDEGKDVFYHQFDNLINAGVIGLERTMPFVDEEGFSKFQLWRLMEIYGKDIYTRHFFKDNAIYIEDKNLESVII